MEKQEKLREWCIEQAMRFPGIDIETVIDVAKKFEDYISQDRDTNTTASYNYEIDIKDVIK